MTFQINWRQQFQKLQPYLDGDGGVVNVRLKGPNCGVNAFLSRLKSEFIDRPSAVKRLGKSIRLDPENYKVRYFPDLRNEFARVLNNPSLKVDHMGSILAIDSAVFSNNSSGRDQKIEANIYLENDDCNLATSRDQWVSSLVSELRNYLKTNRFMIILLEGASEDQNEFWSILWRQASELIHEGLLLVRILDDNAQDIIDRLDKCVCDCEVILYPQLRDSDIPHTIEDITSIIEDNLPSEKTASSAALAKAYVLLKKENISLLHNSLLSFISDLQEY